MFVRLALLEDMPVVVAMGEANAKETRPEWPFDEDRAMSVFLNYMANANPTFYVVEHEREVIAFLLASYAPFKFTDGHYLIQEVLYVRPDKRGTQAAALLMKHLISEAERLEVLEIVGGNDNGFNSERTARFLEHFGFERVGFAMRRTNGRQERR